MPAQPHTRRWAIYGRFEDDPLLTTRIFEADRASPWAGGVLLLWNKGADKERHTVLTMAPGEWRSCEPAR